MNGNFKYTISDTDRNALHRMVTGSKSNTLATRQVVCEFLAGCLEAACSEPHSEPQGISKLPVWARTEADRLRELGKGDSYIRGWLQVMERNRG